MLSFFSLVVVVVIVFVVVIVCVVVVLVVAVVLVLFVCKQGYFLFSELWRIRIATIGKNWTTS